MAITSQLLINKDKLMQGHRYHPHLGEVDQALLREVGCSLLDESQVSEVHAQVWDAGRVAALHTDTR